MLGRLPWYWSRNDCLRSKSRQSVLLFHWDTVPFQIKSATIQIWGAQTELYGLQHYMKTSIYKSVHSSEWWHFRSKCNICSGIRPARYMWSISKQRPKCAVVSKTKRTKTSRSKARTHIYRMESWTENAFTQQELIKRYGGFYHPSTEKLFYLLKLTWPWKVVNTRKPFLQETSDRFSIFQRCSIVSLHFKATLASEENLNFGEDLSLDLTFLTENLYYIL